MDLDSRLLLVCGVFLPKPCFRVHHSELSQRPAAFKTSRNTFCVNGIGTAFPAIARSWVGETTFSGKVDSETPINANISPWVM